MPDRASDRLTAITQELTGLAAALPPGMPQHTRVTAALAALTGDPGELTVLHVRDPDNACTLTLWTGGTEYPGPWAEENIDAAAGHDAESWAARIRDAQADPPSDYREELLAVLIDPPGAWQHITGWDDLDHHLAAAPED